MSIEVISSGLQTTIQDLGRKGWSHMGVPESGAADKFSCQIGFVNNTQHLIETFLNSPM